MMNKAQAYHRQQDPNRLVERYAGLVKRIGQHMLARLPSSVQLDDLLQAGMIGLLDASRNYDATKGASFETYAGIRIRGAMIDEIRQGDWVPRSVHRNTRRISDAIHAVEKEQGRDARDSEVADKLDIELAEYHSMLNDTACGRIIGIEDLGVTDDVIGGTGALSDSSLSFDEVAKDRFSGALSECISQLPEREALILSLYYDEELNLKEIGQILDVSESRISQIHSQALHRIRARLKEWY
jgi:RNA polymerase sigma factor for flagellar operon FliA